MKRLITATAVLLAAPTFGVLTAGPASAGLALPTISLSHSPDPMTIGQPGTITMTLTGTGDVDLYIDLTDTVPTSMTIGTVTGPDGLECNANSDDNTIECDGQQEFGDGTTVSVTIDVTPNETGTFDNDAQYEYEYEVPEASRSDATTRAPAGALSIGGQAQDSIRVKSLATSSPTSTPTPTPSVTPTPTHTPTHKPTHKPTRTAKPTPPASAKPTSASRSTTLPNTGGSDVGLLALVGVLLVAFGSALLIGTRARASSAVSKGRHEAG